MILLVLTKALAQSPDWLLHTQEAIKYAQTGKIDDAISSCERALELKSDHSSPYHLLAQLYLAKAAHKEALQHIQKALEYDTENVILKASLKFHEGVVEQDNGELESALASFKAAGALLLEGSAGTHGQQPVVDVQLLEKVVIAVASLGDMVSAVRFLKDLWRIVPHYQFHNSLPFVRVADSLEEAVGAAEAGGREHADLVLKRLSNVTQITHKVFFDIASPTSQTKDKGRVIVGLYGYAAPRAVHNFVTLASCQSKALCYNGTKFHRIIADFIVQGGDIWPGDGTGTTSVYGRPYSDESFGLALMHNRAGIVQLANAGPDSNGGQFVFMMGPAAHLNGKHVIIGTVLEGLELLHTFNHYAVDDASRPINEVIIMNCGVVEN